MARLNEQQAELLKKERSEQILQAALSIFAENGIEGTKMAMIAKAAGISHGLMYHYFSSKDEVLNASLEWAISGSQAFIDELKAMEASPLDKLMTFTKMALSEGNQDAFRIIQRFNGSPQLDQSIRQLIENSGKQYIEFLVPVIIAGQEAGQMIKEDPIKLAIHYLTVVSGILTDDVQMFREDIDWHISILARMVKL